MSLTEPDHARLVGLARKHGLGPEEAADVVQEAFVTLLRHPVYSDLPRTGLDAQRVLTAIVVNAARNARRLHRRHDIPLDELELNALPASQPSVDEAFESAEKNVALTSCLSTLKPLQQQVVTARIVDGTSGAEAAVALGVSPGNVAVLLHRATAALRHCIERLSSSRHSLWRSAPGAGAEARPSP